MYGDPGLRGEQEAGEYQFESSDVVAAPELRLPSMCVLARPLEEVHGTRRRWVAGYWVEGGTAGAGRRRISA